METMFTSLAGIEKMLMTKRKRLNRVMAQLDKAMAVLASGKPNGKGVPIKIDGVKKPRKTKGKADWRVMQGRYLGCLRGLSGSARDQVKAAKKEHGYTAAIKLSKKLRGEKES